MAGVFILGKYLVLVIRVDFGVLRNWVRIQKEKSEQKATYTHSDTVKQTH